MTERNQWEGETWSFYFFATDELAAKLRSLVEGSNSHTVHGRQYTPEEVNHLVETGRQGGYMAQHNYVGMLTGLPDSIDWDEEDPFYKGAIDGWCKFPDEAKETDSDE
jgi:hypothetical protein